MSAELGSLILIDQLQPGTADILSVNSRIGATAEPGVSLLLFEVLPTGLLDTVADIVFKQIDATPVIYQLDGRVAYLGVTSASISDLRAVSEIVVDQLSMTVPVGPGKLISDEFISNASAPFVHMTNKLSRREVLAEGDAVLSMECQPAPLAIRLLNEAEKAANIKVVDFRFTGSMGRLKIAGSDEDIRTARMAARKAVEEGA